ncbi:nuclear receptor 2C2-associated protein-like [Hydra vulgaris]|uniref:Nuclear receptor 2C2-associated protein-like n=1 Tax=Hydra vulgaris TaxID=6087 RepID=A0ABM4CRN8_HYDVU
MLLNSLISGVSVSSVLNQDHKQYGKKFLFDDNEDTCWNSDKGNSQHICIKFEKPVTITDVTIQFQGGFSCQQFNIYCSSKTFSVYPEDVNFVQKFAMDGCNEATDSVKIVFLNTTDFFGRIIIYDLKLYGLDE